jgi:PAS domain S-box-containing protein
MSESDDHVLRLETQLAQARELLKRHILEHAEAEEALRESEERFRTLIDRAAYGIFLAGPDGRFIEVNPALVAMLEYPTTERLRACSVWNDLFHDASEGERLHEAAVIGSLPTWVEAHWRRYGGTPLTVRLSVRVVRDATGGIVRYEGIADDVTDRRRQEELLRRSERMATLGTTIAGVAHELNNPLAAIMGFAQILLTRPLADEDRASVQTINEEVVRTAKIVRDLLTLLRRREQEHRTAVDLNEVAGWVVRTRRAERSEGETPPPELQLSPSLPAVLGDRSQLEVVVGHLMDNAEQAAADGGAALCVMVRTRRESGDVILEVEDSGPGIPEESLSRIWDPFWTTRGEGRGTGLGLSVVHSIVTQHGGVVHAQNKPGGGARFVVRLPALQQDAADERD